MLDFELIIDWILILILVSIWEFILFCLTFGYFILYKSKLIFKMRKRNDDFNLLPIA